MNTASPVETPSGKWSGDENFPVGSWLLPAPLRPHVAVFYAVARTTDDIADNPDLALYLYHWTNYVLLAHTDWLHRQGLMMPQFTSGQELAPDPRYLPETCYLRRATWQVTGEVYAAIPMRDPPGRVYAANPTAVVDGHRGLIRTGGAE